MLDRRDVYRSLARRILDALGAGSLAGTVLLGAACGGRVVVDAEQGTGGAGGTGGTSTTGTSASTSSGSSCGEPPYGKLLTVCLDNGASDACSPGDTPGLLETLAQAAKVCAETGTGNCCGKAALEKVLCDLPPIGTQCCYQALYIENAGCVGRPFTVAGVARTAPGEHRDDWGGRAAERPRMPLDPATRDALAQGFLQQARAEHASIAAFARLVLELLAVGAPADLLRAAQQAMGDEIRHAELIFALASAHAGAPVGPGPLPVEGALASVSLRDIALSAVREGCIGETLGAMLAAEARDLCRAPAARAALATIADDEAAHAALSWQIVSFALGRDPSLREAIAAAFAEPFPLDGPACPAGVDVAALRAHGQLAPTDVRAVAERTLAEVVRPCAEALLAGVPAIPHHPSPARIGT